jgi:hypothetical protein
MNEKDKYVQKLEGEGLSTRIKKDQLKIYRYIQ